MARMAVTLAGLAAVSAVQAAALAQETCTMSPQAPAFAVEAPDGPLYGLPHPRAAPHTAFHGQGLYGEETLYLSHLPIFMVLPEHHPHNFQVILEVAFADGEAAAAYRADRAQHADTLYTVGPPVFDQLALVIDHAGRAPLRAFPASTVVRGHFEKGGTAILDDVTFEIRKVVHFREFVVGGPRFEHQRYLLFGRGDDVFMAHLLSAPPDFDQILQVEIAGSAPTAHLDDIVEELVANGLYVELPGRPNTDVDRLRAGTTVACTLETGTRAEPIEVELRVDAERYCEAGEFDTPVTDKFNPFRACAG